MKLDEILYSVLVVTGLSLLGVILFGMIHKDNKKVKMQTCTTKTLSKDSYEIISSQGTYYCERFMFKAPWFNGLLFKSCVKVKSKLEKEGPCPSLREDYSPFIVFSGSKVIRFKKWVCNDRKWYKCIKS